MALVDAKFYETKVVPFVLNAVSQQTLYSNIGSNPKQVEISFLLDCTVPAARLIFIRYQGKLIGSCFTNGAATGNSQKYILSEPNLYNGIMQLDFVDEAGVLVALTGRGVMFLTYFN